jgi:hypothetical protein
MAGFIFGVIGLYLVKFARKKGNFPCLFIGITLMVYPYFIEHVIWMWGVGVGLCFLALKLKDS